MNEPGVTIHARYALGETLGSGGTGTVYRALDRIDAGQVAVKVLSPLTTAAALRHRREVLALRVLQVPGVVKLLDEGVADGRPFIVMELIDGAPFPGPGRTTWPEIAPVAIALLETLARVHGMGVIHRDLKPANVLVDPSGRPVLLDFGLARSDTVSLGGAITLPDAVAGTPRYQAPEQIRNEPLDARTDLYAVGVMLYEALSGRNPHPIDNQHVLTAARLWKDAPPLRYAAPDAPAEVCRVVDRLLARLPEARPRTALEVLGALRGLPSADTSPMLPWLGSEEPIHAALDAVRAGRCFDAWGPPGAGRTRFLFDVAAALARSGRHSAWTVRGARPYESLRGIVGDPAEARAGAEGIAVHLEARIRETLAGGTVILADDAEELDQWAVSLLERVGDMGGVVRTWASPRPDARVLPLLTESALRPIFHGPDLLLHLREDAARALFERSGGLPARVVSELTAWVSGGFATWRNGRLAVHRSALDRLEGGGLVEVPPLPIHLGATPLQRGVDQMLAWVTLAWPNSTPAVLETARSDLAGWEVDMMLGELERAGAVTRTADGRLQPKLAAVALHEWAPEERRAAHALLAATLPPGGVGRFPHLVGAGEFALAAREAQILATRLVADGYIGRAIGVLSQGLLAAREAGDAEAEEALLIEAALAALTESVAESLEYVRYEIGRAALGARLAPLDILLRCGLALVQGDTPAMETLLEAMPAYDDPRLALWHRSQQLHVAMRRGLPRAEALLDTWMTLPDAAESSFIRGRVLGWMGLLRYQQGRFAEAAEWHVRALPLKEGPADRLSTMINAASAYLEAQRLTDARRWAREAEALAAELRLALFEGRAAWIHRNVAYRTDAVSAPDLDYVDAVDTLGVPRLAASVRFTEATIAWRYGFAEAGASLAAMAEAWFAREGNITARIACTALRLSCARETDPASWRALGNDAAAHQRGTSVAQTLALVAMAGVVWEPTWTEVVNESLTIDPAPDPNFRRAILADAEVLAYVPGTRAS